jgi:hypothetical protein
MPQRHLTPRSGSIMIEFVFSTLFWAMLLMGVSVIGLNLVRSLQVTEVCRDAGHLYAYPEFRS